MATRTSPQFIISTIKLLLRSITNNTYDSVGMAAAVIATVLLFFLVNNQDIQLINPDATLATPEAVELDDLRGPFLVERVVDGDTIIIDKNGPSERVRLIGVDTPEVASRFTSEECFGAEASAFTTESLEQAYVYTMSDPTQANRDRFDRLLRYIFIDENNNFNLRLIEKGFAYEYTYRGNAYHYQSEFRAAQSSAQTARVGLWAPDACGGMTETTTEALLDDSVLQHTPAGCHHIADAIDHVGASACLIGVVDHVFLSRGGHQFINFCPSHQNCPFSAVVFAKHQDMVNLSEIVSGRAITLSGHVSEYRGQPQIIIRHQQQINTH